MSDTKTARSGFPCTLRSFLRDLKEHLDAGGSWAKIPPDDRRAHLTHPGLEPEVLGKFLEGLPPDWSDGTLPDGDSASNARVAPPISPRHYAAAVLEAGQLQAIAGQLRAILDTVEAREKALCDLAVGELDRQAPEHAAAVAHLVRGGGALCGARRPRGLSVVEWRDRALEKSGAPYCQDCARRYRKARLEDGVDCVRCRLSGIDSDGKCRRCGGAGSYPRWAAEALEAGT